MPYASRAKDETGRGFPRVCDAGAFPSPRLTPGWRSCSGSQGVCTLLPTAHSGVIRAPARLHQRSHVNCPSVRPATCL